MEFSMKNIQEQLLTTINDTTTKITTLKGAELHNLIEPHPDFPHCERFLVQLVNTLKSALDDNNYKVTKNKIISIYKKHEGKENANELRVQDLLNT
jgi:hypothetical protein